MKKILFIVCVTIGLSVSAQDFDWVKTVGNASYEEPTDITIDSSGNIYTT